jgi:cytosine/uracil/thiamine/allantoin permease
MLKELGKGSFVGALYGFVAASGGLALGYMIASLYFLLVRLITGGSMVSSEQLDLVAFALSILVGFVMFWISLKIVNRIEKTIPYLSTFSAGYLLLFVVVTGFLYLMF